MAVPLANDVKLFVRRQLTGILGVAPVHDVGQRLHGRLTMHFQRDPAQHLQIDGGHLLALAQIGDGLGPTGRLHPKGYSAAGTAPVEAQHETGTLGRSTVHMRIDAEGAVQSDQLGRNTLDILESRPPHERSVAENPEIVVRVVHRA